jgi:hypothetical protein
MLGNIINRFRFMYGLPQASFNNLEENENCSRHCLHMSHIQDTSHAPDYMLNGKIEAVALRSFFHDEYAVLCSIVFEDFANSPKHRAVLLMDNLACASYIYHYHIYVTVRGW